MNLEDKYSLSAKYYDEFYARKADLVDLPFYLELAQQAGGPVLELACGTGRVLLPTARLGIDIDGVDNSPAMLGVLREKLAAEPEAVRRRVRLFAGDLRDYRSASRYRLVTIPFRPMQHMYSLEDQVAALRTAGAALDQHGRIAFDVFYPKLHFLYEGMGDEVLEQQWELSSQPGVTVRRYFRKDAVDKINQVYEMTFLFRSYRGEDLIREEAEQFRMAYYTYPHLRALFLLAGLETVREYGGFDRSPLSNRSEQMIFVLRKAG